MGVFKGYTLVEVLIVIVIIGILAVVIIPQFANASDDGRHAVASQITRTVQRQIANYHIEHGSYPTTIPDNWFHPPGLPPNPYNTGDWGLVVQNISGKTELKYKHTKSQPDIYWYNLPNGHFHMRVPWQGSNEDTLKLYNRVNHCDAVNY